MDYTACALFLNISLHAAGSPLVPWWQNPDVNMQMGLDPRTQVTGVQAAQQTTSLASACRGLPLTDVMLCRMWTASALHGGLQTCQTRPSSPCASWKPSCHTCARWGRQKDLHFAGNSALYRLMSGHACCCMRLQMPDPWIEARRQAVLQHRSAFVYSTSPQDQQSASDTIISMLCAAGL